MNRTRRWATLVLGFVFVAACDRGLDSTAPVHSRGPALAVATSAQVSAIDISGGVTGGGGFVIASTGLIVGDRGGYNRGWWQSPSPTFTSIDSGYVNGGNSYADVASDAEVLLTNYGAPPFTRVQLQLPSGLSANHVVARDINDSRAIVGTVSAPAGTALYGLFWSSPSSAPTQLLPGAQPYPVEMVLPYAISNSGEIVGRLVVAARRNSTISVPVVWNGSNTSTTLPLPSGAVDGLASNVNTSGVISGIYNNGRASVPIRWTPNAGGGYDIAVLNLDVGLTNLYTGIDGCGRITGGSAQGAWIWDPTSGLAILPSVGGAGVRGWSYNINSSGQMSGSSYTGTSKNSVYHATLWTGLPPCSTP